MLIYLAQPYSDNPDEAYEKALTVTRQLFDMGYMVFSPVVYFHKLSKPTDNYIFWLKKCLTMLAKCDVMIVLEDYEGSYGVGLEIEFCRTNNRNIVYAHSEDLNSIVEDLF